MSSPPCQQAGCQKRAIFLLEGRGILKKRKRKKEKKREEEGKRE